MNLEKYLTESYPSDQQDVMEVEKALDATVRVFGGAANFRDDLAWPYAIPQGQSKNSDSLSQNTTAMIINTLFRFRGRFNVTTTGPVNDFKKNIFAIPEALEICDGKQVLKALDILLKAVFSGTDLKTTSSTYGDNDIFTLAWLAELSQAAPDFDEPEVGQVEERAARWAALKEGLKPLIVAKIAKWGERLPLFNPKDAAPENHSFPVLRLVQAARNIKATDNYASFYSYFEGVLHEQLSFSSIPDSRFDPAELMFCLEGMLLCQQSGVDRTIFDRVLEVLVTAQSSSAFWRPVKPFMATPQGMVLFPVSVEIANSLVRCCVLMDGDKLHDTYGSKCIPLLRRYWQWLRARAIVTTNASGVSEMGWHSEHVNQTTTIHLWETSQVMDFLMSYRNMLQQHIARTTLVLSRVKEEVFPHKAWATLEEDFEPVVSLGKALAVYENIGRDFVLGRDTSSDNNYSMLLYGPPGTGKTTVATSVAKALNFRMITITVSDFLAAGGAQVESRAKDIFAMLMAQPPCVVLFDEIDHFLLDRDSARYAEQETLFQFMTPGMLTKLADLRQKERVLFIVATNYEDRIDPAIKRTGRIDRKYLVLPPDGKKRFQIISDLLKKYNAYDAAKIDDFSEEQKQSLKDASLFLGFSDIKAVVQIFSKSASRNDVSVLVQNFQDRARTISLEAYQSRFAPNGQGVPAPRETPMAEFLALMGLRCEVVNEPPVSGKKAIAFAGAVISASTGSEDITANDVQRHDATGLRTESRVKIAKLFADSV